MQRCDIIMPTHNSAATIVHTVTALFAQHAPPSWQMRLIISDDGSRDGTVRQATHLPQPGSWLPTVILPGEHTGAAAARNRGLAASDADIVLFLGADIIMRPGALACHLNFHHINKQPHLAALGMVKWDPRLPPTPLMEWMMRGGPQNNLDALLGSATADPQHFWYGSHLSVKRSFLGQNPFPTIYESYGWEDIDCGRALAKRGLTLSVLHDAVALHHHIYTIATFTARQYQAGQGLVVYQRRYPDIELIPSMRPLKRLIWQLISNMGLLRALGLFLTITSRFFATPHLFEVLAAGQLWRGVRAGLQRSTKEYIRCSCWV